MNRTSERLQAKVTQLYIDMRLKRISKLNWMIETEAAIEALRQVEHYDIAPELFYIQLLITKDAYEAAEECLDETAKWLRVHSQEAPACHAYYLYLTTLMGDDEEHDARVSAKLSELSRKHPDLWQISWLLYYTDRTLVGQPLEQYHYLKRMFIRGCRSPLMYLEARVLLERNPTFLYEFSEFEVQLMVFIIRHAGISDRLSQMLAEYILQRTEYRYLYLLILQGCYEVSPSKRVLEGICKMMVLGRCAGEKFTLWYRKAISENIRVPGLFEAFMKSLPVEEWSMDGEELSDSRRIPTEVIEYFAHSSGLDELRTAYLYALVHKHRENWNSLYRSYEPLLQPFMMDQLLKGHINPGLAYLYEEILDTKQIPQEYIEKFLELYYTYEVRELPIEAGTLVVRYAHHKEDVKVAFTQGRARVALYGRQFTLAVENYSGSSISAQDAVLVRLMSEEQLQAYFAEQDISNLYYHMAMVEESAHLEQVVPSVKQVFTAESIPQEFKEEVAVSILPYWDINGVYDEILAAVPYVFREYGTYQKDKETLFWKQRYLSNHIGIYGMQFLLDHYEGSLQEKAAVFTKARGMGIETGAYAEHLIREMLFAEQVLPQHREIFESFQASVENPELMMQYLEFRAQESYLEKGDYEDMLRRCQAELTNGGREFSTLAKLAYLQGLAQVGANATVQEQLQVAQEYLDELLRERVYFSWMQSLMGIYPKLADWEAFQVLEYRGIANGPVWVRYEQYTEGREEAESLRSDVMDMVCEGVYTKQFILFYGERMYYEIFGLEGTEQKLMGKGTLQGGGSFAGSGGSKYSRINRMLALREKRDNQELYRELESYYGQNAMLDQIFALK